MLSCNENYPSTLNYYINFCKTEQPLFITVAAGSGYRNTFLFRERSGSLRKIILFLVSCNIARV